MQLQDWIMAVTIPLIAYIGKSIIDLLKQIRDEQRTTNIAMTTAQAKIENLEQTAHDHEKRIRNLEQKKP